MRKLRLMANVQVVDRDPTVLPILLAVSGRVPDHALRCVHNDPRLHVRQVEAIDAAAVSSSRRMAGSILAAVDDPWRLLSFAVTAGLEGPMIMALGGKHSCLRSDLVAAGAATCVGIPITAGDVDALVRHLLPSAIAHCARNPTILFDPIARTVTYGTESIQLSQKEFALLFVLADRSGRAQSAADLVASVWPTRPDARARGLLEFYIGQLRRKLRRIGLANALVTIRGFGYVLRCEFF